LSLRKGKFQQAATILSQILLEGSKKKLGEKRAPGDEKGVRVLAKAHGARGSTPYPGERKR